MQVTLNAIGYVRTRRADATDDHWGGEHSTIELVEGYSARALEGLAEFSHAEILFLFHQVATGEICSGARRPRGNPAWPEVGIFAQRGRNRPNRIGSTICPIVRVEDIRLLVAELDAIDGTPVLDIKPVMAEFLPRSPVHQPAWSRELMSVYWQPAPGP